MTDVVCRMVIRGKWIRDQRGATTIEYVSLVAVVVVLITVLLRAAPGWGIQLGCGGGPGDREGQPGGSNSGGDGQDRVHSEADTG